MTAPRERHVAFGWDEGIGRASMLIGRSGALTMELIWTHPEYPLDDAVEPPGGEPVTWTVGALYEIKNRGRRPVKLLRTSSAYAEDGRHGDAILAAMLGLLRNLGASVTTMGDELTSPLVATPAEARAYLERDHS